LLDTHFGYPGQNAVLAREKSLKPFGVPSDDRYFDNFVVAPKYGASFEK